MNYQNPTSRQTKPLPRSRALAIPGIVLLIFPFASAINVVFAMVKALLTLREPGAADPSELAGEISLVLLSTLWSCGIGLIGIILVSITLFGQYNRERWFYQSVTVISLIWCVLLFPIGLIPGMFLFYNFHRYRSEFSN